MGQLQRPIHPLFDLHVGRSDGVVNLIELALVGNRAVVAQAARLEAEDGRQFSAWGGGRCRSAACAGRTAKRRL
jgi:hypothetical protein